MSEKTVKMKSVRGEIAEIPESDVNRKKFYGWKVVKSRKQKESKQKKTAKKKSAKKKNAKKKK